MAMQINNILNVLWEAINGLATVVCGHDNGIAARWHVFLTEIVSYFEHFMVIHN